MNTHELTDLFNDLFKFELNQEVRHKGDSKNGYSADMGLLVLERELHEYKDDYNNTSFTNQYICRMIRFSGSGDLARFKESELMTMAEFEQRAVEQEQFRNEARERMHLSKKAIYNSFGVKNGSSVYLIKDGKTDTTNVYTVSGFSASSEGTFLKLTWESGTGDPLKDEQVQSKNDIQPVI